MNYFEELAIENSGVCTATTLIFGELIAAKIFSFKELLIYIQPLSKFATHKVLGQVFRHLLKQSDFSHSEIGKMVEESCIRALFTKKSQFDEGSYKRWLLKYELDFLEPETVEEAPVQQQSTKVVAQKPVAETMQVKEPSLAAPFSEKSVLEPAAEEQPIPGSVPEIAAQEMAVNPAPIEEKKTPKNGKRNRHKEKPVVAQIANQESVPQPSIEEPKVQDSVAKAAAAQEPVSEAMQVKEPSLAAQFSEQSLLERTAEELTVQESVVEASLQEQSVESMPVEVPYKIVKRGRKNNTTDTQLSSGISVIEPAFKNSVAAASAQKPAAELKQFEKKKPNKGGKRSAGYHKQGASSQKRVQKSDF
jgi:hypothetical protein